MSTASIELATGAGSTTVAVARERFAALDSLRGVAALGVAYGHFYGPQILEGTRHFSFYLLVDLFFVLSGFVLAHRYLDDWLARRVTLPRIACHRFARLYPLHLYGLLGILVFSLVRSALYAPPTASFVEALKSGIESYPDGRAYTFVLHLLLLQNIGLTPSGLSWHGPSWSISVEFVAPLLLFMWIGFWRERRDPSFVAPTLVLSAGCALAVVNGLHSLDAHYQNLAVWANSGLLRGLAEIGLGLVAYRLFRAASERFSPSATLITTVEVLMLVLACTLLFRRPFTSPEDILVLPLFALLVLALATERGRVAQLLRLAPFRWLGAMSYSIYINHFLVVMVLSLVLWKPWWLYFGLVLGLSWITFTRLEQPARRYLNARLDRLFPLH